jgi:hypothetical protein
MRINEIIERLAFLRRIQPHVGAHVERYAIHVLRAELIP